MTNTNRALNDRGAPSFRSLFAIDRAAFLNEYWERQPYRLEPASEPLPLLSLEDLDRILTAKMRPVDLTVLADGREVPKGRFTHERTMDPLLEGDIDVDAAMAWLRSGATLRARNLDRYHHPLGRVRRLIESELLTRPVTTCAWIGASIDGVDLAEPQASMLACGIAGSVDYTLSREGAPSQTGKLTEVAAVYVPEGWHMHVEGRELAALVVLHWRQFTWLDVMHRVLRGVVDSHLELRALFAPELLGSRLGSSARTDEGFLAEARPRIAHLRDYADPISAMAGLPLGDTNTAIALLPGQLRDLFRLRDIDLQTVIQRRPEAGFSMHREGEHVVIDYMEKQLRLPAYLDAELSTLLSGRPLSVDELSDDLDQEGKVALTRRMVQEGLVRISHEHV